MNDLPKKVTLHEQRDAYLAGACQAEARGDIAEAQRLLGLALDCEQMPQPGVASAIDGVQQPGPAYKQDQAASPAANLPANGSAIVDAASQRQ
ncbi:MAG TPA: hypothetical protein VLI39_12790 [Sedimentisphaerales bacterium]|nr:hypothetical protein [Sedimentisphaerales bacterium]